MLKQLTHSHDGTLATHCGDHSCLGKKKIFQLETRKAIREKSEQWWGNRWIKELRNECEQSECFLSRNRGPEGERDTEIQTQQAEERKGKEKQERTNKQRRGGERD